jgi:hypothetical protein
VRHTCSTLLPGKAAALCLLAGGLWMTAMTTMSAPARADWLVTRDGGKVETKGSWKLEPKRVVFTLTDGTLSSLRLTEVDLDASRQATLAAQEARTAETTAAAQPQAAPRKSVRVLTDKDFARPEPPAPAPGTEEAATAGAPQAAGPVQVATWKQSRNDELNQMDFTGQVRNTSKDLATGVSLTIRLYDLRGELIGEKQADLDTRTLKAGQNTAFSASFPGVIDFATAKLEANSTPLVTKVPAEDPQPADAGAPPPPR